MPLSQFQKQKNKIEFIIKQVFESTEKKTKYGITLVCTDMAMRQNRCSIVKFKNGKKFNSYPLLFELYAKYEKDDRFYLMDATENHCVLTLK